MIIIIIIIIDGGSTSTIQSELFNLLVSGVGSPTMQQFLTNTLPEHVSHSLFLIIIERYFILLSLYLLLIEATEEIDEID